MVWKTSQVQARLLILMKSSQISPLQDPLFYSVLLMPARLFGPALLFGTLEYVKWATYARI